MMVAIRTEDRLDGDVSMIRDDDYNASIDSDIESARIDVAVTFPT